MWAYQLAVVVDDLAMEIGEVVRGDDLLASTAGQILLYQALGGVPPEFMHIGLLHDRSGERMAKRKGSLTLKDLKRRDVPADLVVGWLAFTLGLQREAIPRSAGSLVPDYDPARLERLPRALTAADLALFGEAAVD
jgi:glutamyl-tRNA synthetase